MLEEILKHKELIKEKDLMEISKYLDGDKTTKLGSKKTTNKKAKTSVNKDKVNIFVNKIWDYLKNPDTKQFSKYIEERAEIIHNAHPLKEPDEIYKEIVNDQKRGNLFTPLHFAIKYQNLKLIKLLIFKYGADVTIENKDGHDAIEYLHFGAINSRRFWPNLFYRTSHSCD